MVPIGDNDDGKLLRGQKNLPETLERAITIDT
jgi:hypothetical protein